MPVHLELSDQRPNEWILWCLHHHNLKTSFPTQQIPAFQLWVESEKGCPLRMSDLFYVNVDYKSFVFLSGFSNCSKGILMIKIIYIFVKLRMLPLDARCQAYFIGLCPNTDLSCLGPMKVPQLHSWDSSMGSVKGLGTTRWTSCDTDRRTLSLTWVVVGVVVLALKETDCLGQTFSAFSLLLLLLSGNDVAALLGPRWHTQDKQLLRDTY